jgi:hypothetical protein
MTNANGRPFGEGSKISIAYCSRDTNQVAYEEPFTYLLLLWMAS